MIPHQVYTFQGIFKNPQYRYIFLDGAGGSGKTYTIAAWLKHIGYNHYQYIFLGPTGKSIGVAEEKGMYGQTLHRFFMIETNDTKSKIDSHIVQRFGSLNKYHTELKKKLLEIKIMFIDEISMVNNHLVDFIIKTMDKIAPKVKIVFSGDYHQLPSVINKKKIAYHNVESSLDIMSELIQTRNMAKIVFITRYRSTNEAYNEWLHDLRGGQITDSNEVADAFEQWFNVYEDNTMSTDLKKQLTFLYYGNTKVDDINKSLLHELPGELHESKKKFLEDIYPTGKKSERDDIIKDFQMDDVVSFKLGSKILFRVNHQSGLFKNGDEGLVEEIKDDSVMIRKMSGELVQIFKHIYQPNSLDQAAGYNIQVKQWPFSLGNARTYHKAQGDGFEYLHLDLDFLTFGSMSDQNKWQVLYVGISRVIDPTKVWIPQSSINLLRGSSYLLHQVNWLKLGLDFESDQMYYQEYVPRTNC